MKNLKEPICTYLGHGRFRVKHAWYDAIVVLHSEVDEVLRGDVGLRGEVTFDAVNEAALEEIMKVFGEARGK